MNMNQNQAVVIGNLNTVMGALSNLIENWDADTQAIFENKFGEWSLPSLDEVMADFASFRNLLIELA